MQDREDTSRRENVGSVAISLSPGTLHTDSDPAWMVHSSVGFRLARAVGEVESWGSAHVIEHPLLTYDVTSPRDDYDHFVGFRLACNWEGR